MVEDLWHCGAVFPPKALRILLVYMASKTAWNTMPLSCLLGQWTKIHTKMVQSLQNQASFMAIPVPWPKLKNLKAYGLSWIEESTRKELRPWRILRDSILSSALGFLAVCFKEDVTHYMCIIEGSVLLFWQTEAQNTKCRGVNSCDNCGFVKYIFMIRSIMLEGISSKMYGSLTLSGWDQSN